LSHVKRPANPSHTYLVSFCFSLTARRHQIKLWTKPYNPELRPLNVELNRRTQLRTDYSHATST